MRICCINSKLLHIIFGERTSEGISKINTNLKDNDLKDECISVALKSHEIC